MKKKTKRLLVQRLAEIFTEKQMRAISGGPVMDQIVAATINGIPFWVKQLPHGEARIFVPNAQVPA